MFCAGFLLVLSPRSSSIISTCSGSPPMAALASSTDRTHPAFRVTYFYKFVRHPLYVGWLLAFWGTPTMTVGHMLFTVGMSGYIMIAIRFEELRIETFLGKITGGTGPGPYADT